jgi:hypothetical protein
VFGHFNLLTERNWKEAAVWLRGIGGQALPALQTKRGRVWQTVRGRQKKFLPPTSLRVDAAPSVPNRSSWKPQLNALARAVIGVPGKA